MTKRFGFTLAEVLITLGIIGVVAAMSIPTLIANTNSAKFRSQFKKTIATLNQAALMSQAQYDFDFGGTDTSSTGALLDPKDNNTVEAILAGTLAGSTIKLGLDYTPSITSQQITAADMIQVKLADGSIFAFHKDAKLCTVEPGTPVATIVGNMVAANCYGFIDVNGAALPNTEVKCQASGQGQSGPQSATLLSSQGATDCTVKSDAAHMKDIYTVVFHDGVVEPSSNASRYVLGSAK